MEGSTGLEVKVLGPGCAQCDRLEQELMAAMAELNLAGDIQHIRDVKEIGKYGVMGTPALHHQRKGQVGGKSAPEKQTHGVAEGGLRKRFNGGSKTWRSKSWGPVAPNASRRKKT